MRRLSLPAMRLMKRIMNNNYGKIAWSRKDAHEAERVLCADSLAYFARRAWPVLEPAAVLKWGWVLDAICEHLEAVTRGEIRRLLANVPPGTMKSLLVGVIWPAWEWGPKRRADLRYLGTAHKQELATRDNLKCRRLIQSPWYQKLWPIKLTGDQNAKTKFENESGGLRESMSFESMTGSRGDRVMIDDPHSVDDANSVVKLASGIQTFREALPSRMNNDQSAIVIIMQRLNEADISAVALELGYEHLCIPMRYEADRKCVTSIGWSDPRETEGELMFPERFSDAIVEELELSMGAYAIAGQLQQRPAPRTGGFFAWENISIVAAVPQITKTVRYWDKAGTEGGGAHTAGVKMGLGVDGMFYVLDVVRGQWGAVQREKAIRQTAETDGRTVDIWIEQEPGSGGKESAEATIRNLAGFSIRSERATGEKSLRAEPYASQVEAGNVKVLQAGWNKEFIDEHKTFPVGKFKDQIDAAGAAFIKLNTKTRAPIFGVYGSQ